METTNQFKSGDRVLYCGIQADVVGIRKNGVIIAFWGMGLKDGQRVVRRVSARQLTKYYESVGAP